MKIIDAEIWQVTMPLTEPYTIAYETVDTATNIFLRLKTPGKLQGFGCAAPDLPVTGETVESVVRSFNDIAKPIVVGSDSTRIALILDQLKKVMSHQPSCLAMIDIALHDLLGKEAGLPVYRLFGGFRTRMRTSITIGILPLEEAISRARAFVDQGFHSLKLKGGKDVERDISLVHGIRKAVGPGIELRFDANQGFTVQESIHFYQETKISKIELIEQPTSCSEPSLLGAVTDRVSVRIMADESIMNLRDAFRLAKRDLIDMVNIKLMKVGGLAEALQINALARAANYEVMVGCMDEAALAIAAGLHFALARPNVAYADLDGHLDLINDPSAEAVIINRGILYPRNRPGFGFDFSD